MGLSMGWGGGGRAYKKQLKEQYPVTLLRMYQIPSNNTPIPEHYKDTNKSTLVIKVILLVHIRP